MSLKREIDMGIMSLFLDVTEIDTQIKNNDDEIFRLLNKNFPQPSTILGQIFDLARLAMIKKKRNMNYCFKIRAFKCAYYILSNGYASALLDEANEGILYGVYNYANAYKIQIFQKQFSEYMKAVSLPSDFYETRDSYFGEFEKLFHACVVRMLILALNYESKKTMIPLFRNSMSCYNKNDVCKKLIAVFAEDLIIDEHLRMHNFSTNYYSSSDSYKLLEYAQFTGTNVNNFALDLENFVSRNITK